MFLPDRNGPMTQTTASRRNAPRGRAALLTSAATLLVALSAPAYAQQTVYLNEGTTAGNVGLNGEDRLVLDISRIDANSAELDLGALSDGRVAVLSGSLSSAAGNDTLWLRATENQTRDVAYTRTGSGSAQQYAHDGSFQFTGGTVYEASGNDTLLTLTNRSRSSNGSNQGMAMKYQPLRLAGDGTVEITYSIQGDQDAAPDKAIYVEAESTGEPGAGDGKLDVVITGRLGVVAIDGNAGAVDVGSLDPRLGLIDVRNANSLRFTKGGTTNSVSATAGNHQLILGGDAEIFIENGINLSLKSPSGNGSHPGRVINTTGRVWSAGLIDATSNGAATNDRGVGVYMEGAEFFNSLIENAAGNAALTDGKGRVVGGLAGVQVASGDNYIDNVSSILSANGAAIETATDGGSLVTRNRIHKFTNGGGSQIGQIGGADLGGGQYNAVAYRDIGTTRDMIVNSGVISADVLMGAGSDTFLYTEATNGVTGTINGGGDITDAYGRSVSTSGTVTFANDLNTGNTTGFNMHGLELNGTGLSATLQAANGVTLINGIKVLGSGVVTNEARIDDADGYGIFLENFEQIPGEIEFINTAQINANAGVIALSPLKSFRNTGVITGIAYAFGLSSDASGGRSTTFDFQNDGTLSSSASSSNAAAIFAILSAAPGSANTPLANFRNTGTVRHTGSSSNPTQDLGGAAVSLTADGKGLVTFNNSGAIEALGDGGLGIWATGNQFDIINSGLIHADGLAGGAVLRNVESPGAGFIERFTNTASGVVRANGGGYGGADTRRAFAFGFGATGLGSQQSLQVDNAGTIEATGPGSIAVAVVGDGSNFILNNTGTIRGGADTTVLEDEYVFDWTLGLQDVLDDVDAVRVVAGAIQTYGTTDRILNGAGGSIFGNVDLNTGDDRFENYGSLDGDVRMGDGIDTFVFGGGSIAAGRVISGGDNVDLIIADMSTNSDKIIDAAQFRGFERIERLAGQTGAGKLFLRGVFDVGTLLIKDLTVNIAAGDTVETGAVLAISGGDGEEVFYNDGRLNGGVLLGGGRDGIVNNGRIDEFANMGAGDDTFVNGANAYILDFVGDAGDDTLTNSGTIYSVSMGDGDDVVVNKGLIEDVLDLGDGDDRYEQVGTGSVGGAILGGRGNDTFVFRLNGVVGSIPGGFDSFESFAAYGPGTLKLALDRTYNTLEVLEGANLELTNAANFTVGMIKGDNSAQSVTIDAGFNGSVKLLGGADTLEMSLGGLLAGDLDGGTDAQGSIDTLKLNLTADSTINNLFGFEAVQVTGPSSLTLAGTLGEGQKITFDGGNNEFIIAENAVFQGQADGGIGSDVLRVTTGAAGSRSIVSGQLTSFESLYADGAGTLEFDGGSYSFTAFEAAGGDISFTGGAKLAAGAGAILFTGAVDNRFTLGYGSSIGSRVDGGDGDGDVLAFQQDAGQIQKLSDLNAENFEILAASGAGELHINQDATFDQVLLEGGNIKLLADVTLTADVIGGSGNDTFDIAGTVVGDVLLGDGDDTYVARTGSFVDGLIDGGVGGNDTVVYSLIDGAGTLLDNVINFESIGVYGPGTLNLALTEDLISVKLMDQANLNLTGNGRTIGNIIGDNSAQTVTIDGGLTGGVSLGGGDDTLNLRLGGVLSGQLDGGEGQNDVLNLQLTAASRVNGMTNFEVANVTSDGHALTLGGLGAGQRLNFLGQTDDELIIAAGAEFKGTVDGGAGQNLLRVQSGASDNRTVVASQILNFQDLVSEGAGTLALTGGTYRFDSVEISGGNLELGSDTSLVSGAGVVFDAADNRLTLGSGASIAGGVDAGDGADTLALTQGQGSSRLYGSLNFTGFERLETSGAGELAFNVDAAFINGVGLNGGTTTVNGNAILAANVLGGDAAETFAILGALNGDLDLGAGDDRLILTGADGSGLRSGGAGDGDVLDFRTNGSYAAPTVYDASRYDGFEKLAVSGGVLSMTSDSSWKGLSLTGGRLIGQAGTVLTSDTAIDVGAGAVFGSAGTVNADINVRGTLSPGSSPGTMAVNGDVSFAAGSNLYLEVSPSLSDLLQINGKMTIANGAAIDITGVLPSTPGAVLDLVVASEGIDGRFATINKSSTVFGFVAQNGNKLQIRGEFQNDNAFGTNAQRSIAYANAVLASGQAVQAFTQAVPVLVDANGVSNAAAFEQLTPEAYGSAQRIGSETALSVVDTARGLHLNAPDEEGVYGFAQAIGLRTELDARARTGAASAELDMGGVFGGVGYSTGTGLTAGAFIGGTRAEQRLEDLDATTRTEGVLVGAFAGGTWAGVNINGLAFHDLSEARTQRTMAATPDFARGRYDLDTWTVDVSVDYPMSLGGFSVIPTAGVTWISSERDAVSETNGGAFALTVDSDRKDGWFADAGIKVTTAMMFEGRAFIPYAEAGVRKVLSDDGQRVTGSLSSVEDLQIDVHGVRRDRTVARLATGFSYEVDPAVTLNAGYAGEYGDNARHNVAVGVSLKF